MKFLRFVDENDNITIIDTALIIKFESKGENQTNIYLDTYNDHPHLIKIAIDDLIEQIKEKEDVVIYIPEPKKLTDKDVYGNEDLS